MPVKFVFKRSTGQRVLQTRVKPDVEMQTDFELIALAQARTGAQSADDFVVERVEDEAYFAGFHEAAAVVRNTQTGALSATPKTGVAAATSEETARVARVGQIVNTTAVAWDLMTPEQKAALVLEYFQKAILRIA